MYLWWLFFDPHPTQKLITYRCSIKKSNRITPAYLIMSEQVRQVQYLSDEEYARLILNLTGSKRYCNMQCPVK